MFALSIPTSYICVSRRRAVKTYMYVCNKWCNDTIDKVYIDGPCGSKPLAGVLLARFERVSDMTHLCKKDQ